MTNIEAPWPNCLRCQGSGVVAKYRAEDYHIEDASVREVPVATCSECGGLGQVAPKNERRAR